MNERKIIISTKNVIEAMDIFVLNYIPYTRKGKSTHATKKDCLILCIDNDENKQICRLDLIKNGDDYIVYLDDNIKEYPSSIATFNGKSGYY